MKNIYYYLALSILIFSCQKEKEKNESTQIFEKPEIKSISPLLLNTLKTHTITLNLKNSNIDRNNISVAFTGKYGTDEGYYTFKDSLTMMVDLPDYYYIGGYINLGNKFKIHLTNNPPSNNLGKNFDFFDSYPDSIKIAFFHDQKKDTLYNYESPDDYIHTLTDIPYFGISTDSILKIKNSVFLGKTEVNQNVQFKFTFYKPYENYDYSAKGLQQYVTTPIPLPDGWYDLTIKDPEGDEIFPKTKSRVYLKSK